MISSLSPREAGVIAPLSRLVSSSLLVVGVVAAAACDASLPRLSGDKSTRTAAPEVSPRPATSSTAVADDTADSATPMAGASFAIGIRCSGPSRYLRSKFGLPDRRGCIVIRISGPAEGAGMRLGDLLIDMNGTLITSGPQFNERFKKDGGARFRYTVIRSGVDTPLQFDVYYGPTNGPPASDDELFYFLRAKSDVGRHPQQGLADYTRAIEIAPDFDLAYMERARLYSGMRSDGSSLADFNKAIEEAMDAVRLGFAGAESGQLIMACGTGKTLVALWGWQRRWRVSGRSCSFRP